MVVEALIGNGPRHRQRTMIWLLDGLAPDRKKAKTQRALSAVPHDFRCHLSPRCLSLSCVFFLGSFCMLQDNRAISFDGMVRACAEAMGKDPAGEVEFGSRLSPGRTGEGSDWMPLEKKVLPPARALDPELGNDFSSRYVHRCN